MFPVVLRRPTDDQGSRPVHAGGGAARGRPARPSRGQPWRVLTALPLLAALVGVSVILFLTLSSMTATMRATDAALVQLTSRIHAAGHVWVDVATQYADAVEVAAAGTPSPATVTEMEEAAADARGRLGAIQANSGSTGGDVGTAYARLLRDAAAVAPLEEGLFQAVASGPPAGARAWSALQPALQREEADAHALFHAIDDAYPQRVSALMGGEVRAHRRALALAFGLVATEFALIGIWAAGAVARPLQSFVEAAAAIRQGDLDARMPAFSIREFTTAAEAFNAMAASLAEARRRADAEHRQALALREERAALVQHHLGLVIEAQEEERRRLARDLHDVTAQALTAVHLSLQRLAHEVPPALAPEVETLQGLARDTMSVVRDIAVNLHPHALDEMGLVPALQDWLDRFSARVPFAVEFQSDGDASRLPTAVETAAFRIAQEAVTNAARHADGARAVRVDLHLEPGALRLRVSDDGCGFDPARSRGGRPGLGLLGMHERARQIGARLTVGSAPGHGTRIDLVVGPPPDGRP